MSKTSKKFLDLDPKDLAPAGIGLAIGCGILLFFVLLGLLIGLSPSIDFGVPHQ